jgi:tetratricopeptide (TPR) repeat protein
LGSKALSFSLAIRISLLQTPSSKQAMTNEQRLAPEEELLAADHLRATSASAALAALQGLGERYPTDPRIRARQGIIEYMLGIGDLGRAALEEAVAVDPQNAEAHKFLGAACMRAGATAVAIDALQRSIRLNPTDAGAQSMLGAFLMHAGRYVDAVPHLIAALDLDPGDSSALSNVAALPWTAASVSQKFPQGHAGVINKVRETLLFRLRQGQLSEPQAKVLLSVRVRDGNDFSDLLRLARDFSARPAIDAQEAFDLGVIFALAGDAEATLDCYQRAQALAPASFRIRNAMGYQAICAGGSGFAAGFAIASETWPLINPEAYDTDTPQWQGEELAGREIFVYQEQGAGDAILALRLLPMIAARGGRVVLWTRPELAGLARHAPGIHRFCDSRERPTYLQHGCTTAVPLLGSIAKLSLTALDIKQPTLLDGAAFIDRERWKMLGEMPRIGLCLLGNPMRGDDWTRSIPPVFFSRFGARSDLQWVNLSVDARDEQSALKKALPALVDVSRELASFQDTASLIMELDVVISIDSVVAHIAASLGKSVLLLAPPTLDWRWQIATDQKPWWPTVEVYRAPAPQAFDEPITRALAALDNHVRASRSP